jgi:hypothetical protein
MHPDVLPVALERVRVFKSLIRNVSRALHEKNIPFMLMGGTLLGWQRECNVLKHTTDIDLAILEVRFLGISSSSSEANLLNPKYLSPTFPDLTPYPSEIHQ